MAPQAPGLIIFEENLHGNVLLKALNEQKQASKFCDVILKVTTHQFTVHSCVLASFSPYFDWFLNQDRPRLYSEKAPQVIEIQITNATESGSYSGAVQNIINYMYSGKLELNDSNVVETHKMAEIMQMHQILKYCAEFLEKKLLQREEKGKPLENTGMKSSTRDIRGKRNFDRVLQVNGNGQNNRKNLQRTSGIKKRDNKWKKISDDEENESDETFAEDDNDEAISNKSKNDARKRANSKGKKYTCKFCNYNTVKVWDMVRHQKETRHQPCICSLCDFEVITHEELVEHLNKHTGKLPFFCMICEHRFRSRGALNLHLPKHSSQKPFVCELCSVGFKWKHALKSHMIVHSNEKNHLCDQCGYATAHKSSLKAHKLLHTGETFKCSYPNCSFQAIRKQNLKDHLLTHTKEKPFQCEICGQSFSLVKNLRRHARLHYAGKPYQCPNCDFASKRDDKLKEHLLKHHNIGHQPVKRVRYNDRNETVNQSNMSIELPPSELNQEPLPNNVTYQTIQVTEMVLPTVYSFE